MSACLAMAMTALPEDIPVGAVVVDAHGQVIATANNRRERDHDPTAHAEVLALREAGKRLGDWRLTACTLYVTLEPCPMCASAIAQARLQRVVFGAYDPVMGACGSVLSLLGGSGTEVIGGILEAECGQLLKDFFRR